MMLRGTIAHQQENLSMIPLGMTLTKMYSECNLLLELLTS
jgi:hypothetical protein